MKSSSEIPACTLFAIFMSCLAVPSFAQAPRLGSDFAEDHPRRTQVLRQDANLNKQINQDYGHLNGQYSQLENTANSIRAQEQQYASQNGGYITIPEWQQLDNREAALQNSINNDYSQANGQNATPIAPWQDFNPNGNATVPPTVLVPPAGLLSILGGNTRQACGWAGNGGFPSNGTASQLLPVLPPTSTSSVDLNTAF